MLIFKRFIGGKRKRQDDDNEQLKSQVKKYISMKNNFQQLIHDRVKEELKELFLDEVEFNDSNIIFNMLPIFTIDIDHINILLNMGTPFFIQYDSEKRFINVILQTANVNNKQQDNITQNELSAEFEIKDATELEKTRINSLMSALLNLKIDIELIQITKEQNNEFIFILPIETICSKKISEMKKLFNIDLITVDTVAENLIVRMKEIKDN